MLLKWFCLFAIACFAYRYWMRVSANRTSSTASAAKVEQMLECTHCGIRFPESEMVSGENQVFCSEQHCASWKRSH